jgi:hypothetical protein
MKSSYFVGIHTGQNYGPKEYTEKAGMLLNLVTDTLGSEEKCAKIVKGALESIHSEIEVGLEQYDAGDWTASDGGWELVCKVVIDIEGSGKLTLDKGKLSAMMRSHPANEWGATLKIEKKAVPKDVLYVRNPEEIESYTETPGDGEPVTTDQ